MESGSTSLRWIALIVILLGLAGAASADIIYLNTGGVIKGEIIEEDDDRYVVKTKYGPIPVNRDDVSFIERGTDKEIFVRADYQHIGETWFHTLQGEQTPTIWQVFFGPGINQNFAKTARDPYDTLNVRAGLQGEKWALTAYGRNVLDEEYLEEIIPAAEFGGSFIHQGMGAAYGVEFSYDF